MKGDGGEKKEEKKICQSEETTTLKGVPSRTKVESLGGQIWGVLLPSEEPDADLRGRDRAGVSSVERKSQRKNRKKEKKEKESDTCRWR